MNFKRIALFGKLCLLSISILTTSVLVPLVLEPPAAIAAAPYFTRESQLESKASKIKIGWTIAQVEALLGKPQWSMTGVYNYYVKREGLIKAIQFKNGRVSGFGDSAG